MLIMNHLLLRSFRLLGFAALLAFTNATTAQAISTHSADNAVRQIVQLNREWTFTLGDFPGAENTDFDDSRWDIAHLPHSFSTPYFLGTGFYVGYGWYRKTIDLPSSWRQKKLSLEFDGVFQDAEVYVNGQPAGRHRGGYTGFTIDITPQAKTGPNTIAIRVNNLWDARLAPRAGEHVFSGGIYRDVRLVATDPVHVSWYGTFVKTPSVTRERATVALETEIGNDRASNQSVLLVSTIYAPSGKELISLRTTQNVPAGSTAVITQQAPAILKPMLWEPDHPAMYQLKSEVLVGGKLVDTYVTPFGIRAIKWTAEQGFFLNDKHVYLLGANVHQDHAGWGDAVTHAAARRDVKMIKDAGFNFIRGSHYPHSPAFTRATDELGVLFWSEVPFWGIGGFGGDPGWLSSAYPPNPEDRPAFEASVLSQTAEMIRIHRNHPSIIVWSNGNETFFTAPEAMNALRDFTGRQVAFMHQLDPSRPVAIGGAQRGDIDHLGDIAGYNGDGATLYPNPGIANIVSEYGSTSSNRPGSYQPGWGDLATAAPQKSSLDKYPWRHAWRSGEAIWAGFDHGSIAAVEFGSMGMIDYFRIPKRQYYWYRHAYAGVPAPTWPAAGVATQLELSADKTVITGTQGHDDVHLTVTVKDQHGQPLSNSPDVQLSIQSGPGEFPTGRSISFANNSMVAIRDGQAAIDFRSYYAGQTRIRATSPGLKDGLITITTTGPDPYVEAQSPLARNRPLVDYPSAVKRSQDAVVQNVSLNRPTSASAAASGHSARLANDGDQDSFWQSAAGTEPSWSVDLENIYAVRSIVFEPGLTPSADFVIEYSLDRVQWIRLDNATESGRNYELSNFASEIKTRFIRIRFPSLPAGQPATIRELRVFAVPAQ